MARLGSIHGRKGGGLVYMKSRVWKRMKKERWKGKFWNRERRGRERQEKGRNEQSIHERKYTYTKRKVSDVDIDTQYVLY